MLYFHINTEKEWNFLLLSVFQLSLMMHRAALLLVTTLLTLFAVTDSTDISLNQSQECAFTDSKRVSCLYFVNRFDKNHEQAAEYCLTNFNGALPGIYDSYNEAIEVMQRYYWWSKSDMNVKQIRFGAAHRIRDSNTYDYTYINPLKYFEVDLDMDIWRRSFRDTKNITLDDKMYDKQFPHNDVYGSEHKTWEYLAMNPALMKYSNLNYNRKTPFVCEVPRFPKAYCERGWWLHMKSRSCFYLHTSALNFTGAAMNCRESLKSNLASINDETENNMALKMIQQKNNDNVKVWFGLRHDASRAHNNAEAPANKKSPEYAAYFAEYLGYNVDGTPVSNFTYFDTNQPDGILHTTENCFLFEQKNAPVGKQEWNDYNCATKAWSICRKMAATEPY